MLPEGVSHSAFLRWKCSSSELRPPGSFPRIETRRSPRRLFLGKLLLAVSWAAPTLWINPVLSACWLSHPSALTHRHTYSSILIPTHTPARLLPSLFLLFYRSPCVCWAAASVIPKPLWKHRVENAKKWRNVPQEDSALQSESLKPNSWTFLSLPFDLDSVPLPYPSHLFTRFGQNSHFLYSTTTWDGPHLVLARFHLTWWHPPWGHSVLIGRTHLQQVGKRSWGGASSGMVPLQELNSAQMHHGKEVHQKAQVQ